MARYRVSRKKACESCSKARLKCIRTETSCRRCAARGLTCTFAQTDNSSDAVPVAAISDVTELSVQAVHQNISRDESIFSASPQTSTVSQNLGIVVTSSNPDEVLQFGDAPFHDLELPRLHSDQASTSAPTSAADEAVDFSNLDLICPIDADSIQNRWLSSYVPIPGQVAKNFPAVVGDFVQAMLRSYTTSAVRGRSLPPFIHPTQTLKASTCPTLCNCFNLIKICQNPSASTNQISLDILQREMNSIYQGYRSCDDMAILATFQAYLIYCLVFCFQLHQSQKPSLREAVVKLQEIACFCSHKGLVSRAEQQRIRPKWEAWIIAESKRRTLYTMYLFDNMLSIADGLPTFLATEVRGVPAPGSKNLWHARTRKNWQESYNIHLVDWAEEDYSIDELWPAALSQAKYEIVKQQERQTRWLETIDAFGIMIFSVTSGIHGRS